MSQLIFVGREYEQQCYQDMLKGTPLVKSRHPGMPPQFLALPLVIKSLFGVSGGATGVKSLNNIGERGRLDMPVQARNSPRKGSRKGKRGIVMPVFVLDQHKQPLMPCSEKRARLLLSRKRAVVHRVMPFTIRRHRTDELKCAISNRWR